MYGSRQSIELNIILPENTVILLLQIFKRIFRLFVSKLKEYLNTKITIHLSPKIVIYTYIHVLYIILYNNNLNLKKCLGTDQCTCNKKYRNKM